MATPKPKSQAEIKAQREKRRKAIARALEMRRRGETMKFIASELGVSPGTVWTWIHIDGVRHGLATQEQKAS